MLAPGGAPRVSPSSATAPTPPTRGRTGRGSRRCASAASIRRSSRMGSTRRRPAPSAAARALGVGPAGQRLPLLAHPARPAGHPRQAPADRVGRGDPRRPGIPRDPRAPRQRYRAGRGRRRTRSSAWLRCWDEIEPRDPRPRLLQRGVRSPAATGGVAPTWPAGLNPRAAPRSSWPPSRPAQPSPDQALGELAELPYADLGFAKLDLHRELRNGHPEAVYAEGKTGRRPRWRSSPVCSPAHGRVLVTRLAPRERPRSCARPPAGDLPRAGAHPDRRRAARGDPARSGRSPSSPPAPRIWRSPRKPRSAPPGSATRSSGSTTSAWPASIACSATSPRCAGRRRRHRRRRDGRRPAHGRREPRRGAGRRGADQRRLRRGFGGLAALLTMLNACAPGVGVVNIDNGYGAAVLASRIARRIGSQEKSPEASENAQPRERSTSIASP